MALRGLREAIVHIHNPLPPVSDMELLKRADIDYVDQPETPRKFEWRWKYNAGVDHETLRVRPGEFAPLQESLAKYFIDEFGEQGAVAVSDPEDEEEVRKAKLKGLKAARKFWLERGERRAMEYRKIHGITKEEVQERKGDLWPYFQNEQAAKACQDEIERIEKGGDVETPKARKRAASKK